MEIEGINFIPIDKLKNYHRTIRSGDKIYVCPHIYECLLDKDTHKLTLQQLKYIEVKNLTREVLNKYFPGLTVYDIEYFRYLKPKYEK